jgi:hypothetical protein
LKATTHDQQQWVILQPVDMTAILFFLFFYLIWHVYIFWIPCFALEIGQHLQRVVMP